MSSVVTACSNWRCLIRRDTCYGGRRSCSRQKRNGEGRKKSCSNRQRDKVADTPSAIVVDDRQTGFTGVAAVDVIEAGGNRRNVPQERQKRLAEILGDEFVRCRRGQVGVFWNPETQVLEFETGRPVPRRVTVAHVMTTTVQQI